MIIKTDKIGLRKLSLRDVRNIFETHNDPQTQKFSLVEGLRTEGEIANSIGLLDDFKTCDIELWTIVDIENNEFIGICGLRVRKDLNNSVDLVCRIHPQHRNKGYATEAIKACLDFASHNLHLHELLAQIHAENTPSHKLMQKTGFTPVSTDTKETWFTYKIVLN